MLISTLATIAAAVIIIFLSAFYLGILLADVLEVEDCGQFIILLFILIFLVWVLYYFYLS
uniref:hypothetical protein n=1 Tax=Lactococcus garvieae TaxID=1363 RepID=UPI001BDDCB4A|nr:hypothetical protein [Lactococcus garvieae]